MMLLPIVLILDSMVCHTWGKLEDQVLIPLFAGTYLHKMEVFLSKKPQPFVIKFQNFVQSLVESSVRTDTLTFPDVQH